MSDALYLTPDELHDHTGLKQSAAQRRKLEESGLRKDVHFFVRADGKIRLLRAALIDRATNRPKRSSGPAMPNFDALPGAR
jgi:hypothetical protein